MNDCLLALLYSIGVDILAKTIRSQLPLKLTDTIAGVSCSVVAVSFTNPHLGPAVVTSCWLQLRFAIVCDCGNMSVCCIWRALSHLLRLLDFVIIIITNYIVTDQRNFIRHVFHRKLAANLLYNSELL